jgi:hypothetical protein
MDFLTGKPVSTGTSRRVLGELMTATWCQFCPGADGAFDRMLRDPSYFPGKTTLVEVHPSGDFGNTDGQTRSEWYNYGGGIPSTIFDGIDCLTGGSTDPNATTIDTWYKGIVDTRVLTPSIVDITTFGKLSMGNGSNWINASVELLNPTALRNLKVHFWVVEDIYHTGFHTNKS